MNKIQLLLNQKSLIENHIKGLKHAIEDLKENKTINIFSNNKIFTLNLDIILSQSIINQIEQVINDNINKLNILNDIIIKLEITLKELKKPLEEINESTTLL